MRLGTTLLAAATVVYAESNGCTAWAQADLLILSETGRFKLLAAGWLATLYVRLPKLHVALVCKSTLIQNTSYTLQMFGCFGTRLVWLVHILLVLAHGSRPCTKRIAV